MPNIIYLNDEILEVVRAKSKAEKLPISTIARDSIEQYLKYLKAKKPVSTF